MTTSLDFTKLNKHDIEENTPIDCGNGYTAIVKFDFNYDRGLPWENCDGHGVVSEWTTRDKKPGELLLCEDRRSKRYYDFSESMKIAKRDGWSSPSCRQGTAGERAERAVRRDYEYLRAFCNDQWAYVTCGISVRFRGAEISNDVCGGIETFKDYHLEHAAEQINYAIAKNKKERAQLAVKTKRERAEQKYWAARDVVTA